MKLLSGILGLTLTSVVALASANAADMYRAPEAGGYKDGPAYVTATWTGWYAGVNGGFGWNANSDQFSNQGALGVNAKGGFGGGQIGYNWQGIFHPHVVLGIEADIQGGNIDDKINFGAVNQNSLDWFGTVRGRVGYAFDSSLIYFTGGFAYGGINNTVLSVVKNDDTATGYVLGGGYEYKFGPAWSLKAEYQYINLGKNDPTFAGITASSLGFKVNDDAFHTVRVGLNYHFAPGFEPLK